MKRIISILLAVLLVGLTFAGCSGKGEGKTDESSGILVKAGTLMVGMEVGYPPMEYLDEDGTTPIGFDVEMSRAIAELLGLELEIVNTAWDGIFAAVEKKEFDFICSSVSITPDREEKYILTNAYISNKIVLAVGLDNDDINTLEDLKGKKVAVQAETTSHNLARDLIEDGAEFEIMPYEKVIQCYDELGLGRIDAILVDDVVAVDYKDVSKVVWNSPEGEDIGICFNKENGELAEIVDQAIDVLYYDGTIAQIAEKYFGFNSTEGVRVVTEEPEIDLSKLS
ncbi:MAG: transporter substrate-binding domain-containing protein [Clostridiales bacterium]|nr:transporter substrate-binding domain-containing protein [Clostridiales bacterium]